MNICNQNVSVTGTFQAVVHSGHEYDAEGVVTRLGNPLRATGKGRNKITSTGFGQILSGTCAVTLVAGTGNTAPTEMDTTLVNFKGAASSHVSTITTRNLTADVDGYVYWRVTYRMTFAPGDLGTGFMNIAEGGAVFNAGAITGATLVGARGLLVDGGGMPTTVSVDADTEYLDLIWEYTEYVKAEATGTVTLNIDGGDVVHDYVTRPVWFDNVGGADNYHGWQSALSGTLPGFLPIRYLPIDGANSNTSAWEGPIAALEGANPSGTYSNDYVPNSMTAATYIPGAPYKRDIVLVWTPYYGNVAAGINVVRVNLGHAHFQTSYDPDIAKIDTKQLTLNFRYTMANK